MRLSLLTPAIVLRTRPYGESDTIVSFLTENHGKITGIAKGAKRSRKRFANSLEPFSLVNLRFQDRLHSNLVFIVAADLLLGFKNLASSLEKIVFASYMVEITDGLIGDREENFLVFHHLKNGLNFLEDHGTSLSFLTSFELKLLRLAGYQPFLVGCKRCGKERKDGLPGQWHFSPMEGGILCEQCSRSAREILPLGAAALTALADLQQERGEVLPKAFPSAAVLKEIRSILLRFIQFQIDREIKSAPFIFKFCPL
jgi:DNA repair protein RecO (recombination protein O)